MNEVRSRDHEELCVQHCKDNAGWGEINRCMFCDETLFCLTNADGCDRDALS